MLEIPVAKEALVFFGHKNNPVDSLSAGEIRKIYSGQGLDYWSQLGGSEEKIIPYQRADKSQSQYHMRRDVMAGLDMIGVEAKYDRGADWYFWNPYTWRIIEYKNYPNALGYCLRWTTIHSMFPSKMKNVKVFALNGVEPTEENIRQGLYPFSYDIVAEVSQDSSPEVKALIKWLQSREGQAYTRELGFVPYYAE